jgi:nucleotide-binding universal stress UspA family protein
MEEHAMYRHILAAVDGSPTSQRALQEAIGLARDQHAALRIVYVVDETALYNSPQFIDTTPIEDTWVQTGRDVLEQAAQQAGATGVSAETKLLATENVGARIADVIAAEARAWPADLLVSGTHGRSGLTHLLLGSVAEGILRITPVPLLLVRGR